MADIRTWDEKEGHYRGYSGRIFLSKVTLTRPADTTQYAAGDQVGSGTAANPALNFGTCSIYNGGGGIVIDAVCSCHANQTVKPNQRLYLFSGSPTLAGDNVNWNPSHADMDNMIGMAEFTSWEIGGTGAGTAGNCVSFAKGINQGYVTPDTLQNLWGAVVERGTYTPVASEVFQYTLKVGHD